MKKFIWAMNTGDDYIGVYINPNYIIRFGQGRPRIRYFEKNSEKGTECAKSIVPSYWIEVDAGSGKSIRYLIDEDTYNNLVNMER